MNFCFLLLYLIRNAPAGLNGRSNMYSQSSRLKLPKILSKLNNVNMTTAMDVQAFHFEGSKRLDGGNLMYF